MKRSFFFFLTGLRTTQNRGVWLSTIYKVLAKTMYTTHHMCVSAASISLWKQMTPETANWKTEETGAADSVSQGIPLSLRPSRSNSTYNAEIDIKKNNGLKNTSSFILAVWENSCPCKGLLKIQVFWDVKPYRMTNRVHFLNRLAHHSTLMPFCVTADSADIVAIPVCRESVSTRCSKMYCS